MGASKDVVIGHLAMNKYCKAATANRVQIRLHNFVRRSLLAEFNVGDVLSIWRQQRNTGVFLCRRAIFEAEIRFLPFFANYFNHRSHSQIFSECFAAIKGSKIHSEDCSNFRRSLNVDHGYPSPLIMTSSPLGLFYTRFSGVGSLRGCISGLVHLFKLKNINPCEKTDHAKGQKRHDDQQKRSNNTEEGPEITILSLSIRSLKRSGP